jgi:endonuclease-3
MAEGEWWIWIRSGVLLPRLEENICGAFAGRKESLQPSRAGISEDDGWTQSFLGTQCKENVPRNLCDILRVMPTKKSNKKKKTRGKRAVAKSGQTARSSVIAKKPAEAAGTDPKRVAAILRKLDEAYPAATCELKHENAFQLLISTIMSAQCTDVRVNQVAQTLYKKYPTPEAFAHANPAELEQEIRPTGFFRNKTKSIMGASKAIIERFAGQVPQTMEELLTVPGAARKTANVVLGTAFGIASGIVVDTHVIRIANRLDLTRNEDPKKIEQDLMKVIPKEKWILFSHQIIWHGRRVCYARKPRCLECNLEKICYSKDKII